MTGRRLRSLLVVPLLVAALAAAPPKGDDPVPEDVRAGITAALQARVASLVEQKDERGAVVRRGSYSKSFHRVDDDTYEVVFHEDTAGETQLKTERYRLTLGRGGGGAWSISGQERMDAYEGLFRAKPGDEAFQRFDAFRIDLEGLAVRAGAGHLYRDALPGGVQRFVLEAADLSYTFEPPMPWDRVRYQTLLEEKQKYLVFEPELLSVSCDAASCGDLVEPGFTGLAPATADAAPALLRSTYEEWRRHQDEERKSDAFAGFYRPVEPHRRRVSLALATRGKDRFSSFFQAPYLADADRNFALGYDSYSPEEVAVFAEGVGVVLRYYGAPTREAHNSLYDLERRDDIVGRDYDLHTVRGQVDLGVGKSELLVGDLTFELTTKRDLRELPFQISQLRESRGTGREAKNPRMTINSVQDGAGRELTFVRTGPVDGLVVLAEGAPTGKDLTLRVQFETTDSIYPLSPSHSYVDRGGWLPFVRFGDFIDDFDLTIRVPAGYTTLGVGKKIEEAEKDGVSVTRWVPESKVAFPSVIFGKYETARSKVKATKLDKTEIPVNIYVDKLSMSSMLSYQGVPSNAPIGGEVVAARGISKGALPSYADQAANALNLYREVFQVDYPYDKLDLVNDPVGVIGFFYGQAPGSLIYLGYAVFRAEGALGEMGGSRLSQFGDSVIAHEVAHQWWGSLITNSNFRNYWFVESLAEYSSALYMEFVHGRAAYDEHVGMWRKEILDANLTFSVQNATQLAGDFRDYRAAVYAKGPYIFHIMRSTWGDEIFFDYLKKMAQELAGKEIVSRDIQYAAEKAIGGDMNWFFDQWLRGVGLPEYTFAYDTRPTEDGKYLVEGTIDQRLLVGYKRHEVEGFFVAVVPVTIECKGGKVYEQKVVLEGPRTPFRFKIAEEPKSVVLNKGGAVLAHDVVEKRGS